MSATFSPLPQNGNRFDVALPPADDLDLSLSNANAFDVLNALGIEDPYSSSPWPIACFAFVFFSRCLAESTSTIGRRQFPRLSTATRAA